MRNIIFVNARNTMYTILYTNGALCVCIYMNVYMYICAYICIRRIQVVVACVQSMRLRIYSQRNR